MNYANAIKKMGAPDEGAWYILSIEVEPMNQEIAALDIDAAIKSNGKISIYEILFDTGKANITPEFYKAIEVIGAYLKKPSTSIFIVGHTDNVGDYPIEHETFQKQSGSYHE